MQNGGWIDLLRLVPEKWHENLLIMTADGSEVFVSEIVRMEQEYVALRGRVIGTSDTGLAFFVPYDRIAYVRFQKPVPDEALYALYGLKPPELKPVAAAAAEDPGEAKEEAAAAEQPGPVGSAADRGTPARGISRQELLERLRRRRHQAHAPGPAEGAAP